MDTGRNPPLVKLAGRQRFAVEQEPVERQILGFTARVRQLDLQLGGAGLRRDVSGYPQQWHSHKPRQAQVRDSHALYTTMTRIILR